MEKLCKHFLTEGTCSLCNGQPRSTEAEVNRLAPKIDPSFYANVRRWKKFRPMWEYNFDYRNPEDYSWQSTWSIL